MVLVLMVSLRRSRIDHDIEILSCVTSVHTCTYTCAQLYWHSLEVDQNFIFCESLIWHLSNYFQIEVASQVFLSSAFLVRQLVDSVASLPSPPGLVLHLYFSLFHPYLFFEVDHRSESTFEAIPWYTPGRRRRSTCRWQGERLRAWTRSKLKLRSRWCQADIKSSSDRSPLAWGAWKNFKCHCSLLM